MAGEIVELGRLQVGIDRHDRKAECIERKPVQYVGRPVLKQHHHPRAGSVADCGIGFAQLVDFRKRVAKGQFAAVIP